MGRLRYGSFTQLFTLIFSSPQSVKGRMTAHTVPDGGGPQQPDLVLSPAYQQKADGAGTAFRILVMREIQEAIAVASAMLMH